MVRGYRSSFCSFSVTYLSQTCDKTCSQISPSDLAAILKYVFKYTLFSPFLQSTAMLNNSGGGPAMGTGPWGDQLPRTQWSVNSSVQTNSQSSGAAGQAGQHVCAHLCVERMKKKWWWWWAVCSKRGQEASETDPTASLKSLFCHFYHLSIPHKAFRTL